nr:hypothetical protein OG409_02110 [Streptomyces sp. NBC_00974]
MGSKAFVRTEPHATVDGPEDPQPGTDGLLLAPVPSDRLSRPVQRAAQAAGAVVRAGDRDPSPDSRDEYELVSIQNLVARLRAAYPLVDAATVEATVKSAYDSFDRARVRAFIPILVERRSRKALGAAGGKGDGRGPDAVTATAAAPCPPGPEKG